MTDTEEQDSDSSLSRAVLTRPMRKRRDKVDDLADFVEGRRPDKSGVFGDLWLMKCWNDQIW